VACRPPLPFQDCEVKLVAPPALKPLVLHEVRLLPHPEPGCKTSRTVIVGINPGHDARQDEGPTAGSEPDSSDEAPRTHRMPELPPDRSAPVSHTPIADVMPTVGGALEQGLAHLGAAGVV
jgi:hypothetical protein